MPIVPFIMGLEPLLGAVLYIVSLFPTVEALCLGGIPVSWCRYISSGWWSSSLSPVPISSSSPIIGGVAPAEVHWYWDIVHGWRCVCGVVVLGAASLLVVILPAILEEGSSRLVVDALEWGSSCKAFLQDAFNYCTSLGK